MRVYGDLYGIREERTKNQQEIILLLLIAMWKQKNQEVAGRVDSRCLHGREPEVGREWSVHASCCSLKEPLNFLNNVTKITLPKGKESGQRHGPKYHPELMR